MTYKIYLASTYHSMSEMQEAADVLIAAGHQVTSQWIYGDEDTLSKQAAALMDLVDVDKADIVLSYALPPKSPHTGGGRHVEFGYGFAHNKRMIFIGPKGEHIFHYLPNVEHFDTLEDLLKVL